MRDINYPGHTRHETREQVDETDSILDGNAREASAAGAEPDRVERSTDHRSMQEDEVRKQDDQKDGQLRRDHTPQVTLAKCEEPRRKTAVAHRRFSDPFRDSAEQRKRAERDNQRRQVES